MESWLINRKLPVVEAEEAPCLDLFSRKNMPLSCKEAFAWALRHKPSSSWGPRPVTMHGRAARSHHSHPTLDSSHGQPVLDGLGRLDQIGLGLRLSLPTCFLLISLLQVSDLHPGPMATSAQSRTLPCTFRRLSSPINLLTLSRYLLSFRPY